MTLSTDFTSVDVNDDAPTPESGPAVSCDTPGQQNSEPAQRSPPTNIGGLHATETPDRKQLWSQLRRNVLKVLALHALSKDTDIKNIQHTLMRLVPYATNPRSSKGKLGPLTARVFLLVSSAPKGFSDKEEKLLGRLICSIIFVRMKNAETKSLIKHKEHISKIRSKENPIWTAIENEKVAARCVFWLSSTLREGLEYFKEDHVVKHDKPMPLLRTDG
ncbi:hypothetical protein BGZ63DRAFT_397721 [Mariannaea sp. PMI_226]|nr:hypothetical protein BGZ63DRAFT_397721 [Mariannaea sp. PMI_226]